MGKRLLELYSSGATTVKGGEMAAAKADSPRNRRRAPRYQLALKVRLDGGEGVTRDLSATGVYFTCDRQFAPDSPIEFVVQFDGTPDTEPVRLRFQGRVLRVEDAGGRVGVATSISSHGIVVVG